MVLFNESCLVEGCNFNFFFPDISIVESRQTLEKKKTFPVVLVYLSVQCALLCVSEDGLFLFFQHYMFFLLCYKHAISLVVSINWILWRVIKSSLLENHLCFVIRSRSSMMRTAITEYLF